MVAIAFQPEKALKRAEGIFFFPFFPFFFFFFLVKGSRLEEKGISSNYYYYSNS